MSKGGTKNSGNQRRSLFINLGGLLSHVLITNAKGTGAKYLKRWSRNIWWTMEDTSCLKFKRESQRSGRI
jgi:hypothetical protein